MNNQSTGTPTSQEESPPQPTYAPVATAMGVTMLAAGILTHWTISLAGGALICWALWTWMNEICQQWGQSDEP